VSEGPRRWITATIRFGLGVLLFALVIGWLAPSWDELVAAAEPRAGWLVVGLLGTTAGTAAASARWKVIAETLGQTRLPYGTYFHVFALNRVLAQVLPSVLVDLVGRGVTLRAAGSTDSVGRLSTLVVVERVLDLCLPLWLLVWAVWVVQSGVSASMRWTGLAVMALVFAGLASVLLRPAASVALRLYRRIRPGPKDDAEIPDLPPALARRIVGLTLLRYASLVVQFWGLGLGVGARVDFDVVLSASTLAQLASIIAITPGGLGFAEGGWAAALQWQHVDATTTSLFVLASRLGMAAAFGILTVVTWRYGRRRAVDSTQSESPPAR
jgi:uncharacterized membrane protein YbhN (UPF0104 family)